MIYQTRKSLVLASCSPRRKAFLDDLGLNITVWARDIDETPLPHEDPQDYVERMAYQKALAVQEYFPERYVLAADTAVCLGTSILGKPRDDEEAVAMLLSLSGQVHRVRSGICLVSAAEGVQYIGSVATEVRFANFDEMIARAYVGEGESLDKAGAYGIQGKGAFLVEHVAGSYTNVVGLPLAEVVELLTRHGVIAPASPEK